MRKWEKRMLIWGLTLILVGAAAFTGVLWINGFNLDAFAQSVSYQRRDCEFGDPFDRVKITEVDARIHILPAADGVCSVTCDDSTGKTYEIRVKDGVLEIKKRTSWLDSFSVSLVTPELIVRLPEGSYESLELSTVSGDMRMENLQIGNLEIDTVSGDVALENMRLDALDVDGTSAAVQLADSAVAGKAGISTVSGDICLEKSDAASFNLNTVSGDITGSLNSGKQFRVNTVSGEVQLPESEAGQGRFKASTTSGDVTIEVR